MFQSLPGMGVASSALTVRERVACDPSPQPDCVSEMGAYTNRNAAGEVVDAGKYLMLWVRDGSDYKILYDSFSSDKPPPAAAN